MNLIYQTKWQDNPQGKYFSIDYENDQNITKTFTIYYQDAKNIFIDLYTNAKSEYVDRLMYKDDSNDLLFSIYFNRSTSLLNFTLLLKTDQKKGQMVKRIDQYINAVSMDYIFQNYNKLQKLLNNVITTTDQTTKKK